MTNPLAQDLDHILAHTEGLWEEIRGQRLFLTGGTGFFGCWLLESFAWANDKLGLGASALVLGRNPEAFAVKAPHLASHPAIRFQVGDVRGFDFPEERFSHVIHAATESTSGLNERDPLLILDSIIGGTRRTLDFAVACGARKFLLTSSGAVYGKQPPGMTHVPETYLGAPDTTNPLSAYGEGKRAAELLCSLYYQQHGLETKLARCFAFVGPYLPLSGRFAIGNFIRDEMAGGPISVRGDGTDVRSYLYGADLAIWLWTILFKGRSCDPYNVGSERAVSIAEAARTVAEAGDHGAVVEIEDGRAGRPGSGRYVPSTMKARIELDLEERVDLRTAVRRTTEWHASREGAGTDLRAHVA